MCKHCYIYFLLEGDFWIKYLWNCVSYSYLFRKAMLWYWKTAFLFSWQSYWIYTSFILKGNTCKVLLILVKGNRVCHPKIGLLGYWLFLIWLFLGNKGLKRTFDFPPNCLKTFSWRTCTRKGDTMTINCGLIWTNSDKPGGTEQGPFDSSLCLTVKDGLSNSYLPNICFFLFW